MSTNLVSNDSGSSSHSRQKQQNTLHFLLEDDLLRQRNKYNTVIQRVIIVSQIEGIPGLRGTAQYSQIQT